MTSMSQFWPSMYTHMSLQKNNSSIFNTIKSVEYSGNMRLFNFNSTKQSFFISLLIYAQWKFKDRQ